MTERRLVTLGPPMTTCGYCGGHGLVHGYEGAPIDCPDCGGGGVVEARDARGRFLPWPLVEVEVDQETCDYCGGTGSPYPAAVNGISPTCPECLGRGVVETWTPTEAQP